MAVRIRIARVGKTNSPVYRIVAADSRCKRDGRFIEHLGTYNPLRHELVKFHEDRLQYWVGQGAQLSDTVQRIYHQFKKQRPAQ